MENHKKCNRCGELKKFDEYYSDKSKRFGISSRCKLCVKEIYSSPEYLKKCSAWKKKDRILNPERYKEYSKKQYISHKDKILARVKIYAKANPDVKKRANDKYLLKEGVKENLREKRRLLDSKNKERNYLIAKAWAEKNKDKKLASVKAYQKRKPYIVLQNCNKRRASKLKATPDWSNDFFIKEAYHLANLRTKMTGFKWHVDHIVPLRSKFVCGLHVEFNLQVIPAVENMRKSNRIWPNMP